MSKLQPNFSFKYTDTPTTTGYKERSGIVSGPPQNESQSGKNTVETMQGANRFQYEMGMEHILVSNSINATIDDASYFARERQTSFTWITGAAIFTVTLSTGALPAAAGSISIPTGIDGNFTVIELKGAVSNGSVSSSFTLPLPYLDVVPANDISISRQGTNIVITGGGTNYSTYSGYVTVYFIKTG